MTTTRNPHEDSAITQLAAAEAARSRLDELYAGMALGTTFSSQLAAKLSNQVRDAQAAAKVFSQLAIAWELAAVRADGLGPAGVQLKLGQVLAQ